MLKNEMVRIRQKRYFAEQKLWVFIGRVMTMNDTLIHIEGKGILISNTRDMKNTTKSHLSVAGEMKGQALPVDLDTDERSIIIPIANISNIRVLPRDFNLNNIQFFADARKIGVKVNGAPDTWIGEFGES